MRDAWQEEEMRTIGSGVVAAGIGVLVAAGCSSEGGGNGGDSGNGNGNGNADGGNGGDQGLLRMRGVVRGEAPLEATDVELHVGQQVYTAASASDGTFTIEIDGDDAGAFADDDYVRVRAAAADTGEGELDLVLVSHIGDWARVAAALDGGEAIDESDLPRLAVDAFRTAEAGLIRHENGGDPVRDWDRFQELADDVAPGDAVVGASAMLRLASGDATVPFADTSFESTAAFAADPEAVWDFAANAWEICCGDDAAALARLAEMVLDTSHGADAGAYEEDVHEPAYVQAYATIRADTTDGAWVTEGGAGRLRANGFDAAELRYEDGAAVFDYDGELSLATGEVYDGEFVDVAVTHTQDRLTLLSRGERSDLVLLERERRVEFEGGSDRDDLVEASSELVRLWRADRPLDASEEDFHGDWIVRYKPEDHRLRQRNARSPNDLRLRLEEGGSGEVVAGGWHEGETITWQVEEDALVLEREGDVLRVELVTEPLLGDIFHAHVEIGEGGEPDERGGFVGPVIPADHDSEWQNEQVPGVYLRGDGLSAPAFGFALELDGDNGGRVLLYRDGSWTEFTPLGWSLEDGEVVVRRCLELGEGWRGLTGEPGAGECDRGYDRRALEPDLLGDSRAHLVGIRDYWNENDIASETPDAVWRAMAAVWGRYDSVDDLPIPSPELPTNEGLRGSGGR